MNGIFNYKNEEFKPKGQFSKTTSYPISIFAKLPLQKSDLMNDTL